MSIFADTPTSRKKMYSALVPSTLGGGYQNVDPAGATYLLNEDGGYILDEQGTRIVLETGATAESSILAEDGGDILSEDSSKILTEDSGTGLSLGQATPLAFQSTPCLFVDIVAKSTNTAAIWVGGANVTTNMGAPIYALGSSVKIDINDLSHVYIYGLEGEGVTFVYGYNLTSSGTVEGELSFDNSVLTFNP